MGIGIVSLEFLAGSAAFLWPNIREGLGGKVVVGTAEQIAANEPEWATGLPYAFQPARVFFVNVPAAKSLVDNPDNPESIPDPGSTSDPPCRRSTLGPGAVPQVPAPRLPDPAAVRPEPLVRMPVPRLASTPCWARSATVRRRAAWTAST